MKRTIVAADNMLEQIIIHSLVTFSIVLIITKSKILACKRKFVDERYKHVLEQKEKPCFLHKWHHAFWTCSMCCGFWIAAATSHWLSPLNILWGTLSATGINWLFHCLENYLFWAGKTYEMSENPRD